MDLDRLRVVIGEAPLPDIEACRCEIEHLRGARGLLDAREVEVLGRLDELTESSPTVFPEEELARAGKTSRAKAARVRKRRTACTDVPEIGAALADGRTTGDRVDALATATSGLTPQEMERVAEQGSLLAAAAADASDREYRAVIDRVVGQARDDDGLDRLARQRKEIRVRWWTGSDGMWNVSGTFDPVRGTEIEARLRATIDALFQQDAPTDAPADPTDRQAYLAALALVSLLEGTAPGTGAPDITVLIDHTTFTSGHRHAHSVVDAGLGRFGLPVETVRRWACTGTVTPVVVGADGVRLFLGRETRLANRAQRRALRVLYRTCALCDVPFEHTQAHHVSWFTTHHGPTDIDNLIPLCRHHHHLAHEGGWHLHLAPDRTLTITRPNGEVSVHGPPQARAA